MDYKVIYPWEVSEHFPQSVIDYWKPYTDKLSENDWYLYQSSVFGREKNNIWEMKSPFMNESYNCRDLLKNIPEDKLSPVRRALHKMNYYYENIDYKKPTISDISHVSYFVEKWIRETYLRRYLTQYDILRFTDEEVWELISDIWRNNEFNCETEEKREMWYEMFNLRPRPESLVSKLPEKVKIYRGGHPDGFAWSVSRKVGERFHLRNSRWDRSGKNWLCERTVMRDEVAFYTDDRIEDEVVVFPRPNFSYTVLQKEPD